MSVTQPSPLQVLGPDGFRAYWAGAIRFCVYGQIIYRDIFGDTWEHGFAVESYVREKDVESLATSFRDARLGPKFSYTRKQES